MTVGELVELLKKQDQDCEVAIGYEGTFAPFGQIYTLDEDWVMIAGKPFLKHGRLVVVATF